MRTVANVVIAGSLNTNYNENVFGVQNNNIRDAVDYLYKSFQRLTSGDQQSFVWATAREEFVDNFSRLVNKSST